MASGGEEKKPSSKTLQKRTQQTSKVKFDLDVSQHTDEANESLEEVDECFEFSALSNPSSSADSTTNGTAGDDRNNRKKNNPISASTESESLQLTLY